MTYVQDMTKHVSKVLVAVVLVLVALVLVVVSPAFANALLIISQTDRSSSITNTSAINRSLLQLEAGESKVVNIAYFFREN